jgi:hypothetical protein
MSIIFANSFKMAINSLEVMFNLIIGINLKILKDCQLSVNSDQ